MTGRPLSREDEIRREADRVRDRIFTLFATIRPSGFDVMAGRMTVFENWDVVFPTGPGPRRRIERVELDFTRSYLERLDAQALLLIEGGARSGRARLADRRQERGAYFWWLSVRGGRWGGPMSPSAIDAHWARVTSTDYDWPPQSLLARAEWIDAHAGEVERQEHLGHRAVSKILRSRLYPQLVRGAVSA